MDSTGFGGHIQAEFDLLWYVGSPILEEKVLFDLLTFWPQIQIINQYPNKQP